MRFFVTKRGFTLVEMLVVVGIIALLAGVVIFSVQAGKNKAYDSQRVSDLSQLQVALRVYKDVHGTYPSGTLNEAELNNDLGAYLSGEIHDPKTGTSGYGYVYEADSADCGGAIIYARSTDTGNIGNWESAGCTADSEPAGSTDPYVIKL